MIIIKITIVCINLTPFHFPQSVCPVFPQKVSYKSDFRFIFAQLRGTELA